MGFCDSTEVCPPPLGFSDSYALLLWEPDITLIVTFSSPDVTSCVKEIKFTSPCIAVLSKTSAHNVNITYALFMRMQSLNIFHSFSTGSLCDESITVFTLAWCSNHVAGCKKGLSATFPMELPGVPAAVAPSHCSPVITQKRNRGVVHSDDDALQQHHLVPDADATYENNEGLSDNDSSMHEVELRRSACSNKRAKLVSDANVPPARERGQDARDKGPRGWIRADFDNLWHQFPSGWPFPVSDTYHRNQLGLPSEPFERTNALQFCFDKIDHRISYPELSSKLTTWGTVHFILQGSATFGLPLRRHAKDWVGVRPESAFGEGGAQCRVSYVIGENS